MTRFSALKRFGLLVFGLLLGLMLVVPSVGAAVPPPGSTGQTIPGAGGGGTIQAQQPPKISNIKAWRSAGGMVDVECDTVNATQGAELLMPGTITLKSHNVYQWGESWHFHVTGLTPDTLYKFTLAAHNSAYTTYAYSSVMS